MSRDDDLAPQVQGMPDEPQGYDATTNTSLVPLEWKQYADALRVCAARLQAENERVRRERDEARDLNKFFRDSVGECHVMISRNTGEYQIRQEWEATDLPPRIQKVMRRALAVESALAAARSEVEQRDGWVMVPREPTEEMIEAGKDERMKCLDIPSIRVGVALTSIYRAMLSALPSPPAGEGT